MPSATESLTDCPPWRRRQHVIGALIMVYGALGSSGPLRSSHYRAERGLSRRHTMNDNETKIVFWHRDKTKGTYRAVFADLSVKDVSAEQVKQVR